MKKLEKGVYHIPIMANECIELLNVQKDKIYFDGTLGGGGHSELILQQGAFLVATDKDSDAIQFAQQRFSKNSRFDGRYRLIKDSFFNAKHALGANLISELDGAILDLGISSFQVDEPQRGFSYMQDAPLDMRMDTLQALSAYEIVNTYSEQELANIIFSYGEERFSRRIAKNIINNRPISTTLELAELIKKSVPYIKGAGHAAKKTFMALRIAVNGELEGLDTALRDIVSMLKTGATLVVLAFHSLEDRIVKRTFKALSEDCICPKSLPMCVCGHKAEVQIVAKGIKASEKECQQNPRAKSAVLRAVKKL